MILLYNLLKIVKSDLDIYWPLKIIFSTIKNKMKKGYLKNSPREIIEEDFDPKKSKHLKVFLVLEMDMGQRHNFEEEYSGDTFQGSYIEEFIIR